MRPNKEISINVEDESGLLTYIKSRILRRSSKNRITGLPQFARTGPRHSPQTEIKKEPRNSIRRPRFDHSQLLCWDLKQGDI